MKPSHYVTPRTLAETNFSTGYSSARSRSHHTLADRCVMWACAFAGVAVILIVALVPEARA